MRTLLAAGYPLLHVRRVPEIVAGFIRNYFLRKRMHKISAKKGIFGTKTLILARFGPFQAIFGPFLTLFNEKTPFFALVGEIFPPISSLCIHFLLARLAQLMVLCMYD